MTVIVEFTLADREFPFGKALMEPPGMSIEFERIVPMENALVPFLWVHGGNHETFEQQVAESDRVVSFTALDRLDDGVLYRMEWRAGQEDVFEGIRRSGATVLEAYGSDGWTFRLRFPDHDSVSQFYNYCTDHDIPIDITRSYTLTERSGIASQFDLTNEQREALVLALERGYYDTPSDATLTALAEDLDISQQALSNRIHRGTKNVLEAVLK